MNMSLTHLIRNSYGIDTVRLVRPTKRHETLLTSIQLKGIASCLEQLFHQVSAVAVATI